MEQMLELEKALEAIKHGLVRGHWKPGEALTIREVAEELGVSVTPVRDAFNELVTQGILEQRAGVGTRVANPSFERLVELWRLRAVLEGLAASWLAERANKVTLAALTAEAEIVDEIMLGTESPKDDAQSGRDSRAETLNEAEDQFHRHFVESADSPDLLVAWKPCHFLLLLPDPVVGVSGGQGHRHQLIMEAVASGDPDLAERVMREHVLGPDDAVIGYLHELARQADAGIRLSEVEQLSSVGVEVGA